MRGDRRHSIPLPLRYGRSTALDELLSAGGGVFSTKPCDSRELSTVKHIHSKSRFLRSNAYIRGPIPSVKRIRTHVVRIK